MNKHKLENPKRVEELAPEKTLRKIGVDQNTVFFDYGAGTGIFSIAASRITQQKVYAYDISDTMLDAISEKVADDGIENIVLLDEEKLGHKIDKISADNILVATVYHHIEDKEKFFDDIDQLLKKDGKVSLIEFYYKDTPMGPPLAHRVHRQTVIDDFTQHDYMLDEEFEMGENFYLISFVKSVI